VPASTLAAAPAAPGYYGKLPVRGDFIGRRLGRSFVDAWDNWLQEAIYTSRAELGERWLDLYLGSPIWRFALSGGVCGPEGVAGVMIPSVDSVGRYFPLMVGGALGSDIDLETLVTQSDEWYGAIEARILSTLEPGFTLDLLEATLPTEPSCEASRSKGSEQLSPPNWYFPTGAGNQISPHGLERLRGMRPPASIWWTEGSEHVAPCCLVCAGLPSPRSFGSMLDGCWQERNWMALEQDRNGSDLPRQEE